ncbi:MAG TPA: NADH-quinone oxidoreductase subunit NuoF [Clostridia bacterium]|jgi:NADP-reducing hydrogenase subunit HndC|nr:NADH-quinone oxidoreductase subunit NuoF [Clostridiaceae bacterium]HOF25879.1 NADH-quinone oxidoreductase subunit NuoF [Clostridia bacterium]HOM33678.1 NADH-quinone oxidoreductase subunit NuoF [Clostridia bacterium]HOR88904.1 NADH-quinone oxidoreductase subunit NuoF [Clostridia bacterium]HOT71040.1 NADH-quinone oxidoreductase subunit NuoF [Clostridia bacterium]
MKSLTELKAIKQKVTEVPDYKIVVGMATCGIAAGANPVFKELKRIADEKKLSNVDIQITGCIGICRLEPIVEVYTAKGERYTYVKVDAEKAQDIIQKHIIEGKPCTDYLICDDGEACIKNIQETKSFKKQIRIALRNCGNINPENIDEYIKNDGYFALGKVLTEMKPAEVIQLLLDSGLRGRGGAGFPTGLKWKFAAAAQNEQKYVCCNADEGDPGAFMDRSVLEGDPHSILEAMAIAGYAIGSDQGFIYVRAEYPVAVKRLNLAIKQAKEYGLLGNNIFGTDFSFDIELRLGAGAFVCGEETALMTSIEGKRGEPRPRPPFPANKGLFGKPTILNNVETFANIPVIINKGADWFNKIGTEKSKGTKVFAVGGKINNTGLIEIPMGMTLREVIYEIGGGIPNGKAFKAAQTGGPSGGCIPAEHLDVAIDYDNLIAIGSMMGSGGLIVMDEDNCMVDIAHFFLGFTVDESCGKCPPCRIGTHRMLEMLEKITAGKGEDKDIEKLERLAYSIKEAALCGLGQTAPNPVLSTLRYFKDEYKAHIYQKTCPAGVCKNLLSYNIDAEKCIGCGLCARNCPANAITGVVKSPYTIDKDKCIKCGVCMEKCKFGAIYKK